MCGGLIDKCMHIIYVNTCMVFSQIVFQFVVARDNAQCLGDVVICNMVGK